MTDQLLEDYKKSILSNAFDFGEQFLEMGIDELTDEVLDKIVIEFPIVGKIYKLYKGIGSVKAYHEMKCFIMFFTQLRHSNISQEVIEKHVLKLKSHNKKMNNEVEMLLIHISKCESIIKSQIISLLYIEYLKHKVLYVLFYDALKVINDMFITDLFLFTSIYKDSYDSVRGNTKTTYLGNINKYEGTIGVTRLTNLGLLSIYKEIAPKEETESFLLDVLPQKLYKTLLGCYIYNAAHDVLLCEFCTQEKRKAHSLE